jgi:hypothetical protein
MIVIDANAVDGHGAVVVVTDAASIAYRAMMHARKLKYLTLLAKTPPLLTHGLL